MALLSDAELTPPVAVRNAASKGVELHDAGRSGDGLKPETVRRANSIAVGEPQSEQWATVEAPAWFARHADDFERGVDDQDGEETPGYVAWLLWGGDPGRRWVERLKETYMQREQEEREGASTRSAPVVDTSGGAPVAILPGALGALLADSQRVAPPGALGVAHMEGPLYPRAYYEMRRELAAAVAAGERTVVLHVDSPGGYVAGIRETRRAIARARAAGVYVVAYVSGSAASAALWVASAADEIVASPTAMLGSVGVVVTIYRDDDEVREVVSSMTPRKRESADDPGFLADLQARVDDLARIMLDDISADRGVSVDALGGGAMFGAVDAVARGLADRIATDADDWMFLGGAMPLDYSRRVRSVTVAASTPTDGGLDMTEQERAALTAQNETLAATVEHLKAELSALREQAGAHEQAAAQARAEVTRRDAAAMVETHVAAGRIPQASRGAWVERACTLGTETVSAMLADLAPIVPVGSAIGHNGAGDALAATDVTRANDIIAAARRAKEGAR